MYGYADLEVLSNKHWNCIVLYVMEFVEGSSLYNFLDKVQVRIPAPEDGCARSVLRQ